MVSRRQVWMESIGVASGYSCKEVNRFPHITYPYLTSALFAVASLLFVLFMYFFPFK